MTETGRDILEKDNPYGAEVAFKDEALCEKKREMKKKQWQGYKHINGNFQAKPAWIFDSGEARSSPMVAVVSDVVEAESRAEALQKIEENIKSKTNPQP